MKIHIPVLLRAGTDLSTRYGLQRDKVVAAYHMMMSQTTLIGMETNEFVQLTEVPTIPVNKLKNKPRLNCAQSTLKTAVFVLLKIEGQT